MGEFVKWADPRFKPWRGAVE